MRLDQLGDDRDAAVASAVAAFLERDRPDAIYAPLELVGVGVQHALLGLGVRIPDDVMTATTYDAGRSSSADPPMSTLTFDSPAMGRAAAEMLLDVIQGRRRPPLTQVVPTRLVARASTARG
jgi:LacI family transcriptional regulator